MFKVFVLKILSSIGKMSYVENLTPYRIEDHIAHFNIIF